MFSLFKKKTEAPQEELIEEIQKEEPLEEVLPVEEPIKVEKKSFFSRALEKTVGNLKSIIPEKKEKIEFTIQLIESEVEKNVKRLKLDKKKKIKLSKFQKILIAAKTAATIDDVFQKPTRSWKRMAGIAT